MSNKPLLACAVIVATIVSGLTVACVALYRYGLIKTREVAEIRLDPFGMKRFATDPGTSNGAEIIFFGDSRIEQWHPLPIVDGYKSVNRGQHSQTTLQIMGRLQQDVISRRPVAVVLQLGINDLKAIGLFPERKEEIVCQALRNIALIQQQLLKNKIRPFLLTIIPPGPIDLLRRPVWDPAIDDAVQQVNCILQEKVIEDAIVIDCSSLLGWDSTSDSGLFRDTLHLTPRGYAILENLVLPQIEEYVAKLSGEKG